MLISKESSIGCDRQHYASAEGQAKLADLGMAKTSERISI